MEYDFHTFQFGAGAHARRKDGMCIMEAVAYVAGEKHSDHPECASPVIAGLLRRFNDNLDDERRRVLLSQFVFRLVGTKSTAAIERERAWMATDWVIRVAMPLFLELVPALVIHGKELRALAPVTRETLAIATSKLVAARIAAEKSYWVVAEVAEVAEVVAVVAVAADVVAEVAAAVAVEVAVVAVVASERALKTLFYIADRNNARLCASETVWRCQESCVDLIDRMIRLTEPQEIVPAKSPASRKMRVESR